MIIAGYQTGVEIGWGEESTVFRSGKPGAQEQDLALKVRRPIGEEQVADLLEAAQQQEEAARAGCRGFAPMLASGLHDEQLYHVTPRYPRSLDTLIRGKVSVRAEGLLHLAGSVLTTLRDLQRKLGRAHGNLKPANILLNGTARLRDSGIFLTDLAPGKPNNHGADLHELGLTIYGLVRRREINKYDWPLAISPDWKLLGPRGANWLSFTNKLLDPKLHGRGDALDVAELAFRQLEKEHGVFGQGIAGLWPMLSRVALGIAAVLVIGGVIYAGWKIATRERKPDSGVGQIANTDSRLWFPKLVAELNAKPTSTSADSDFNARILKPVRDLALKNDEAQTLLQTEQPPADERLARAAKALPEIEQALATWTAKTTIERAATEFDALGWTLVTRSLARLRGDFLVNQPILDQVAEISRSSVAVAGVQTQWQQMGTLFGDLQNSGDPVLAGAPEFAKAEAGKATNLDDLRARLDKLKERLTRDLAAFRASDRERLKSEGNFANFSGSVDFQRLGEWEAEVQRFQRAPEDAARLTADWNARFEGLDAQIRATQEPDRSALADQLRTLRADAGDAGKKLVVGEVAEVEQRFRARFASFQPRSPGRPLPPAVPSVITVPTVPNDPLEKDRQTFTRLVSAAATEATRSTPAQAKGLRDRLAISLGELRQRTSPDYQPRIASFIAKLSALEFKEQTGVPTAPSLAGWAGPTPTATGASYQFRGFANPVEFILVPADVNGPAFYLSAIEMPVGLVAAARAPGIRDAPAKGPRVWEFAGGQFGVRKQWAWETFATSQAGFPFYPKDAPAPPPPSPLSPMNYISAVAATELATALGGRLPSASEWLRASNPAPASPSPQQNLRDTRWEQQRAHVAAKMDEFVARAITLRDAPWPDSGTFFPAGMNVDRERNAQPVPGATDNILWLAPVDQGAANRGLFHMIGNVAEIVADNDGGRLKYAVLGGSALSPKEVQPLNPYELSAAQRATVYADVGFRLALTAQSGPGGGSAQDVKAFQALLNSPPTLEARAAP